MIGLFEAIVRHLLLVWVLVSGALMVSIVLFLLATIIHQATRS